MSRESSFTDGFTERGLSPEVDKLGWSGRIRVLPRVDGSVL